MSVAVAQDPRGFTLDRHEGSTGHAADWITPLLVGVVVFMTFSNASDAIAETYGVPSTTELVLLVLAMALVLGRAGRSPSAAPVALLAFGAYFMSALATLLWAEDTTAVIDTNAELLRNLLIALLVVFAITDVRSLRAAAWAIVGVGLFLGAISVHQYVTGSFDSTYGGFGNASIEHVFGESDGWRVKGPFADPNFFAQMMVATVPVSLDRAITERGLRRWVALTAAVLAAATVIVTLSRGGFLALIVALVLVAAMHRRRWRMLLLVAIAVAVAMPAMPAQYSDRVNTLTDALPRFGGDDQPAVVDEPSYRGRASELIAGWQMFLDHPVGGVGAGNYVVHYQRYATDIGLDNRREDREAHNLYLEVASETGALGVVSFGVVFGLAALGMRRGRRSLPAGDRNLVGGLGAGLVAFLISGIFLHADYARPLWLLAAIGLAVGRLRTQAEPMPLEPSCQA